MNNNGIMKTLLLALITAVGFGFATPAAEARDRHKHRKHHDHYDHCDRNDRYYRGSRVIYRSYPRYYYSGYGRGYYYAQPRYYYPRRSGVSLFLNF
jgi:hypothetical protein